MLHSRTFDKIIVAMSAPAFLLAVYLAVAWRSAPALASTLALVLAGGLALRRLLDDAHEPADDGYGALLPPLFADAPAERAASATVGGRRLGAGALCARREHERGAGGQLMLGLCLWVDTSSFRLMGRRGRTQAPLPQA